MVLNKSNEDIDIRHEIHQNGWNTASQAETVWPIWQSIGLRIERSWASKLACAIWFFFLGKEVNWHCQVAHFTGNAHWIEPSPLFAHTARPTPLKCKNEHLVLALEEETAIQAVVGSIV